jgi:hypothetical protein
VLLARDAPLGRVVCYRRFQFASTATAIAAANLHFNESTIQSAHATLTAHIIPAGTVNLVPNRSFTTFSTAGQSLLPKSWPQMRRFAFGSHRSISCRTAGSKWSPSMKTMA